MMRHSTEIRRVLTEESQEGTRSGNMPRRSQDFSAPSRDIPDQPSPKTPKEYLDRIREKSKYLTFSDQHDVLREHQEDFNVLQKGERSKLQSPFGQYFLSFLESKMPDKNTQVVVDSLRKTWKDIIKHEESIKAQLKNHEEQVKSVEEWIKKKFGEQLDRLPDQPQHLKSEWEQTHREVSNHQKHLQESVNSAQCFDDILSAKDDNYALVRKLCYIQLKILNFMDHAWYKKIIIERDRIDSISKGLNDRKNRIEEFKKRLEPKESTHLGNQLKSANFDSLDVELRVDKSLTLASTTEPFDVDQRVHCMQTLKNDIEQYARLQTDLDSLLAQYSTGTLRSGSSWRDTFAQAGESSTKAWDATTRITDMSTTYHYNPLQITDKQISLIQDYIKSGNMKPKHILDTDVSIGRYNEMSHAFSGEQNLKTQINYAIKSQSNTYLLQDLIRNGIAKEKEAGQSRFGMDAASTGEIEKCIHAARTIGIDAREISSRITLSNPNMQEEDMDYALTNDVRSFVVHNPRQLTLLYIKAQERGVEKDVEIITRIPGPPDAKKTGGDKFGANLNQCEAMLRFSHTVGMKPKGMAVHVGWQVDSAGKMKEGMSYAFAQMAQTFEKVKNKYDIELSILDLGGGWPNQFRGKPVPSISENAAIVRELMDKYFVHLGSKKPALILEPGNYLSAAAGVTKANIINIDEAPKKPGMLRCVLDVGMFNGGLVDGHYPVSMIIDGKAVETFVSVSQHQESQHPVVIFGPSCDSSDKVIGDVMLSDNPGVRKRFEQMMEANNVCSEMLKEFDSIDNSQKQSYIAKAIQKAQTGSQLSIVLHGTGAYTSEYNVGKVGERGFNSICNPELVIISKGRVIEAGVSPLSGSIHN